MLDRRQRVTSPGHADALDPQRVVQFGAVAMRPARLVTTVIVAGAIAIAGCSAHSTAADPAPSPQPPATASPPDPATTKPPSRAGPDTPPSTRGPSGQPATGRCAASTLRGSVQGRDGAAGHIWYRIQLANASTRTCTLKGIPEVRLLGAQGQPLTAPSVPGGPAGSLVVLRPGQAARFAFSEPNACDSFVTGSRLRVTLPQGRGSLTVPLGEETRSGPARASAFRPSRHPRHRRPPACPGSTGSRIPRWRPTAWLRPGSAVTARPPPSSPPAGPSMSGWSANDHRPSGRPSCPAGWWTWACICARTPLASPLS